MTHAERRAFWRERVAAFHESGLSVAAWCREHDVRVAQMRRWIKRIAEESAPGPAKANGSRWLAIGIEPIAAPKAGNGTITLRIGEVTVDVRPGFDAELLTRVVRVLKATC